MQHLYSIQHYIIKLFHYYFINKGATYKQYNTNTFCIKILKKKNQCIGRGEISTVINRHGGVQVESSPRMLDIVVQSTIATDLSRINR